jgi:Ca2+-binding EF-hand superfamily protein
MLDFKKLDLGSNDVNRLFSCFLEIDTDGSGEISLDEFYDHFKLPRSIFSDMAFSLMDEDKSGEIDFREFILTLWNYCSYDFKELCR